MDNFFEYEQAGREKHQRFMQLASDQQRVQNSLVREAPTSEIQRLRPVFTSLMNLVANKAQLSMRDGSLGRLT